MSQGQSKDSNALYSISFLVVFRCIRFVYVSWIKGKPSQPDEILVRHTGCMLAFAHCHSNKVFIHLKVYVCVTKDEKQTF